MSDLPSFMTYPTLDYEFAYQKGREVFQQKLIDMRFKLGNRSFLVTVTGLKQIAIDMELNKTEIKTAYPNKEKYFVDFQNKLEANKVDFAKTFDELAGKCEGTRIKQLFKKTA